MLIIAARVRSRLRHAWRRCAPGRRRTLTTAGFHTRRDQAGPSARGLPHGDAGAVHAGDFRCALTVRSPRSFTPGRWSTPTNVRGSYATLNQAVRADHWPGLQQARGKVVFLMDQKRWVPSTWKGNPSLKGRILFTNAEAGTADAAFIEQNDAPAEAIKALVRQGYLIRARA